MSETTPLEELPGIRRALVDWFQSQEIEPVAASFICAQMAGILAAQLADRHKIRLSEGLGILEDAMRKSAKQAAQQIKAEKNR